MNALNGAINDAKARSDYYYSLADEYYSNPDLETEYKLLGERQRQMAAWLTELKNDREILNGLSHYFRTLMMKSIFDERQLDLDMRAATAEERESVKKYIECIGIPTGVNFNDIIEVDKSVN